MAKITIEISNERVFTTIRGTRGEIYTMLKSSLKGGILREFVALTLVDIMAEESEEMLTLVEEEQIVRSRATES